MINKQNVIETCPWFWPWEWRIILYDPIIIYCTFIPKLPMECNPSPWRQTTSPHQGVIHCSHGV